MKLLIFSDIHQDWESLRRITAKKADFYICLGDLSNRGVGLDQAGEILAPLKERLWLLPGNNETWEQTKNLSLKYGFIDFHQKVIKKNSFTFAGLGYSTPTPFTSLGIATEEEFREALTKFEGLENLFLFCHHPPKNTALDKVFLGSYVGSQAIRDFLEKSQPIYFFSGHVHENEGKIERIYKTTCFNVGKKGLEIWL